jgi:hypothetical protein
MVESQSKSADFGSLLRVSCLQAWYRLSIALRQWFILTQRYWDLKKTDRWYLGILILQAPFIGLLLVLVFHEMDPYSGALMFTLAVSALWFGVFSSIREIVSEQAIYYRERKIGLKIPAYVFSKIPVLFALSFIQCLILLLLVYPGVAIDKELGISANFSRMIAILLILFLTTSTGVVLGLMLSALSILLGKQTITRMGMTSSEVAMSLLPLALLPQVILGGPFIIFEKALWITKIGSKLMVSRWTLSALLNLERSGPRTMAKQLSMRGESIITTCIVIGLFWLLFIVATMVLLKLQEVDIGKKLQPLKLWQ